MKKLYPVFLICALLCASAPHTHAQPCAALTANYTATESRCVSTGSFSITAGGGSGNYNYKVSGPVSTPYTSSNIISGLRPGNYTITVKDVATGCERQRPNAIISGNYLTPNFTVTKTNETCEGGGNGTITVTGVTEGRSPFSYTIIAPSASNVGLSNSTGFFTNLLPGTYLVQQKDSCGNIQTRGLHILPYTWWISAHQVVFTSCGVIQATINLRDNRGNINDGNPVFSAFVYGAVRQPGDTVWSTTPAFIVTIGNRRTIELLAKDGCGNMKRLSWTNNNRPSVAAEVTTTVFLCNAFTARVTGQTNLTNPVYCLFSSSNVQLACNTSGVFNNLPFGTYCIRITDACYDTTITRCFTKTKPAATANANVQISNITCTGFTATVTGWSNLFSPQFCLFTSANQLISCNNTGQFTNIPFGSYCIYIRDAGCTDTVFSRCFTVQRPRPAAGPPVSFIRYCTNYTMQMTDTANLNNPQFCLYTQANELVACNTTGIFTNLSYRLTYCIRVQNNSACYDTTITHCFSLNRLPPSVAANVQISNKTCSSFTARVTGLTNTSNPEFCLYNSAAVLLACNTTGRFDNIAYGAYCIQIRNNPACYDTVITRCFTQLPDRIAFSLQANPSCVVGRTNLAVTVASGIYPVAVRVYQPGGQLVASGTANSAQPAVYQLAPLPAGGQYKVVCTDACNQKDSALVSPVLSTLTKNIVVTQKCPSVTWLTGSNDITTTITSNLGAVTTTILKKNNLAVTIPFTTQSGSTTAFLDLEPAVYILEHRPAGCSNRYYDTVTARPYAAPQLQNSSIYQCDNNSFSVSTTASHGIAPFMYEIIGNVPATPALISPPQQSPVFNINTGAVYSLIRLRAVDACGNAALNDANILPLANISSSQSSDCFYNNIVLRTDSFPNATYTWYRKTGPVDSTQVAYGVAQFVIPFLLPSDTGRYVCRISINNQCLVKLVYFNVTGLCDGVVLNLHTRLYGYRAGEQNRLYWQESRTGPALQQFIIERAVPGSPFTAIGIVAGGLPEYEFTDLHPLPGGNLYRLKMIVAGNSVVCSNAVLLKQTGQAAISVFPNPAKDIINIKISGWPPGTLQCRITNAAGTTCYSTGSVTASAGGLRLPVHQLSNGYYHLTCTHPATGQTAVIRFMVSK